MTHEIDGASLGATNIPVSETAVHVDMKDLLDQVVEQFGEAYGYLEAALEQTSQKEHSPETRVCRQCKWRYPLARGWGSCENTACDHRGHVLMEWHIICVNFQDREPGVG